jgi:hypothetical protein
MELIYTFGGSDIIYAFFIPSIFLYTLVKDLDTDSMSYTGGPITLNLSSNYTTMFVQLKFSHKNTSNIKNNLVDKDYWCTQVPYITEFELGVQFIFSNGRG